MSLPDSYYNLTDKKTIKTLEDIFKVFGDDEYAIIGGIAISIYSYINNRDYYKERYTQDIDLSINREYQGDIKAELYRILPNRKIKEAKLFGYEGIKIESKDLLPISILFTDYNIPYDCLDLKFDKKKIKLKVAKLEYLLINKIFTYLKREEEKDMKDIEELSEIMKNKGYDKELLKKIFSDYSNIYEKHTQEAIKFLDNFL